MFVSVDLNVEYSNATKICYMQAMIATNQEGKNKKG